MGSTGVLDGLQADLEAQRAFVSTRVPVYARILEMLPAALPMERLGDAWEGRTFDAWYERPLLLLAALRADALAQGPEHPLGRAIVGDPDPAWVTPEALEEALAAHRGVWQTLRRRHLQTNETSRAVAWLWPARLVSTADPGCSLHLFDIGASAGLNLVADALPDIWSRSDGTPLSTAPLPRIGTRRGYDLRPLDADDEEGARWLRACVWPGQGDREKRLEQALAAWRASDPRPELVQARAADVPGLLPTDQGRMLAFQTVMRDYLPAEERARYEAGMLHWLEANPPGLAVWIELEVSETVREGGPPATMTAHLADATFVLASCHPHPAELQVNEAAVREFRRHLA